MKTIINSCKRTYGFRVSIALITCLLFLIFPSCQKDESEHDYLMSPLASSNKGKPTATIGKVKDVDGNWYKTVKIGEQWWMAENLKTTKYNDRTPIPFVDDNSIWSETRTPAYCWYDNDETTYKDTYGALYKWYTVNTGKLCPKGWHVPSDDEWKILEMYLGMTQEQADAEGLRGTPAGGKLKEVGIIHWESPNKGATNETGFTALPGGDHEANGIFSGIHGGCCMWSSTDFPSSQSSAWQRFLGFGDAGIIRDHPDVADGLSVRCLMDK